MAKDKAPAFQLYAADFFVDTAGWTAAQVGAYFRLLLTEWVNGPLSPKITELSRIAGVDLRNFKKMWLGLISEKFVEIGPDSVYWKMQKCVSLGVAKMRSAETAKMLINLRLEETRKEQEEWREKQRESGFRGAKERWKDKYNNDGNPNGNPNGQNMALQSSVFSLQSSPKEKDLKASVNNQGGNGQSAFSDKLQDDAKNQELWKQIEKLALIIRGKGLWDRAPVWARMKRELQGNLETVILALQRVLEYKPQFPQTYVESFFKTEDQNENERRHIAESQKHKEPIHIGKILKNEDF